MGRPFARVLVANRGEIALRVVRACHDEGFSSVAVYAEEDAASPYVKQADSAVALAGHQAAETYLNIDQLIAAGRRAGVDAVHPGYGFLSENADFAQAVIEAGMVWIGPPPSAIRELGAPGRDQGRVWWRRTGIENRPHPERDPSTLRVRGPRSDSGLRARRMLR
jgi:acetyl-CoA/propionyl-CoA carboxylase biotin carboxyl carrier protein